MIRLEGLKKVEKIQWNEVQPGMIFLGGIKINDTIPFELRNFPVLTASLLEELTKKYYFLSARDILVLRAKTGYSPTKLSKEILETRDTLHTINSFRSAFLKEKQDILHKHKLTITTEMPFSGSDYIEKHYLIKGEYNSFSAPDPGIKNIPSFFHSLKTGITLGHLLTGKLSSMFNLPEDEDVLLHLVADISSRMQQRKKLDTVFSFFRFIHTFFHDLLKNTEIRFYVFSGECRPVTYPISGREFPRGDLLKNESNYSSFIKKVLHFKDSNRRNKVILFTDSEPTDSPDALHYGKLFKKNNIDYTQIIFSESDHNDSESKQRLKSLSRECTGFVKVCGGNQVLVKINEIAHIIALECYDRYLGFLTLLNPAYTQKGKTEHQQQTEIVTQTDGGKRKGKVVKKWKPKVIRRGK